MPSYSFRDVKLISFLKKILFIFRQRERERERKGEKHRCVVASRMPPTGDLAHNPGMCSDRESNQRPIGLQAVTQSTEPHQPGPKINLLKILLLYQKLVPGLQDRRF